MSAATPMNETLWVVPKWIHDAVCALSRPRRYIVASWYVKPADRVWREDRIKITYRVGGTLQ